MSENTIIDTEAPMAGACSPLQLRPIPGETLDSFEGFMCYFNLGHNRTLKGVAEKLDLNISTVKEWSAKHHWVDRILEYEAYVFNTRIASDAAAAKELALAKVEREALRRQKNTRLSNFLAQLAEKLLEHHLLHNLDKTKLSDILKIFSLATKVEALGADDASTDPDEQEKATLLAEIEASLKRIKIPGAPQLLNQLAQATNGSTPAPQTGN
jgi:hypothetical protein